MPENEPSVDPSPPPGEAAQRGAFDAEPSDPFFRRPLQLIPPALIIAVFLFLCSGLISPFITPLNGDEAEGNWDFCVYQYWAGHGELRMGASQEASPLGMGASYSGMHNLTFWLRVLPYDWSGWVRENFEVWNRIHNLIATFVMLWLVYGLGRWALGPTYGLIALFLAAFMQYTFLLAIEGNYLNETSAAHLAAIWAFMAGDRREGRGAKGALGAAAGAFAALAWLLYFSGRIAAVGLLLYCAIRLAADRRWLRKAAPLLLGFAAVFGPSLAFFIAEMARHPEMASFRQVETQLLRQPQLQDARIEYGSDSTPVIVWRAVKRSFVSYWSGANTYHSYSVSGYLDGLSALLLLAGAVAAFAPWRQPFLPAILAVFALHNIALGALTAIPYPPYHQRVHFAILLAAYLAAVPLWLLSRAPGRGGQIGQGFAAIACLAIAAVNANRFLAREFSASDPYMLEGRRRMILEAYIAALLPRHEIVTFNHGANVIAYTNVWVSRDPQNRFPESRVYSLEDWNAMGRPKRALAEGKRILFIVQDDPPIGAARDPLEIAAEGEIESALPGGRWMGLRDDRGLPCARVYIPPRID